MASLIVKIGTLAVLLINAFAILLIFAGGLRYVDKQVYNDGGFAYVATLPLGILFGWEQFFSVLFLVAPCVCLAMSAFLDVKGTHKFLVVSLMFFLSNLICVAFQALAISLYISNTEKKGETCDPDIKDNPQDAYCESLKVVAAGVWFLVFGHIGGLGITSMELIGQTSYTAPPNSNVAPA